jgi:hypothetical protein
MRWLLGFLFIVVLSAFGGYVFVKGYPYRLYTNWVQGKEWNKYYSISNYKTLYLKPVALEEIPPYKEDYAQLWKIFPLRNAKVPLPVRHPLFQTIPLIESTGEKSASQFGIIILSPDNREISRVYTLPNNLVEDHSQGQELFKLPFVRNRILKLPLEKLWKDVFTFEIVPKSKTLDELIYDLYILHLRSKILPKGTIKYGLINDGKAVIELAGKDKDYIIELVMTYDSGSIYSYVLKTEKNKSESLKLRSKFLDNISFGPVDSAMGTFLYTEFKQLNFARQVDQEGMLYLFSGWSQELSNVELLREMIFYLERGKNRGAQLKPLYAYALKQYGKTFTTKKNVDENDDPNIVLQRKIDIEAIEEIQQANKEKVKQPVEPDLTPDEKMNLYLKKAKEEKIGDQEDMTIH